MTYLNNAATTVAKPKTVKNAPPASCHIAFVEEEFCEVGAVLAGHARDEGNVLFAHKIRFLG